MSYPGNPQDPYAQPGGQPPGYQPGGYPSGGFQQPGYPSGGFQQPGSGYPSGGFQQPGYPQQPAFGQQPPPGQPGGYGQYPPPQYAAGYPGYGQPAKSGRPGMVTAAAVLAFVWGGLGLFWSVIALFAGSVLSAASSAVCDSNSTYLYDSDTRDACNAVSGAGTFLIVITIGLIVVAALLIAGGVTAINGKNGQILVIACALYAVLAIVGLIVSGAFGISYLLGVVVPVLIVVFMLNSQSRAWFRS
uniref:hypothetical protein n=1 Tax=Nakamurella sp. TaxID=1869182 RepID=UPI003B3A95BE